jgi:threonylcarbamoyladenosine tRNA methylthiotransferase MtaB
VDRVFSLAGHAQLVAYAGRLAADSGETGQGRQAEGGQVGPGRTRRRARPYIKIQDGCDARCSYCIVPLARGTSTSLPQAEVLRGVRSLAHQGFAEVVLSGIHLGHYGRDLDPPTSLAALLQRLATEGPRLRLSSIEPLELDAALIRQVLDPGPQICPHLHLPLQSGDDRILSAMNRPYRAGQLLDLLADLRRQRRDLALGADLMVGFPGETEAQFGQTLELLERAPLTHLHVFRYSPRPGTPAASLPGRVGHQVSRRRAAALRQAGRLKQRQFAAAQVGRVRPVVVETHQPDAGLVAGLTDNYLRVSLAGDAALVGTLLQVRLEAVEDGGQRLRGRAV